MPSTFTREQVAAVAALANLELNDAELDLFAKQLGDVLAYVDQLREADTTGVPAAAVDLPAVDRKDDVRPSLDLPDTLANAPDAAPAAGLFKVPRVLG